LALDVNHRFELSSVTGRSRASSNDVSQLCLLRFDSPPPHCVECFTQYQQTESNSHTPPRRVFSTKQDQLSQILHNTPWKRDTIERVDNLAY